MSAPTTRRLSLAAALSCALIAASPMVHAAPDAKLLQAAQQAQGAVVETLKGLVAIESGSADLTGLARMADTLEGRLKALGFSTERRKASAGPGADIVLATIKGSGTKKIMLQGHMDTVYSSGILQSQAQRTEGNRLYGPGIADDKGGLAVMLHALQILGETGWKNYAQLTVLVNPDEEIGSVGSGELIAELGAQHDVVLSFEPTGAKAVAGKESILLGAAGTAAVTMEVKGRAAHAGAAPELGRNAIIEMSHQLLQTRDIAKGIPGAQLNWTNVISNKATNQIPEIATARADVRLTQPGAEAPLLAALQAKVASSQLVPDTETSVKMVIGRPAFRANAGGQALAAQAVAIYRELDRELGLVPMTGGGTDAGYAGRSGKAAVLESLGLAGFGYHARDEYIELDSIVPRLYLTTRLLTEIGKP